MKKKLLFFLLTAVCTLLCAPPASAKVIIHDNSGATWPANKMGIYYTPGCSSWDDSKVMKREGDSNWYSYEIGNATKVVFRKLENGETGNQTVDLNNPVNFGIYKSGGWTSNKRTVTKTGDASFAIHGTIFDGNWTSKNMSKENGKWMLKNVTLRNGEFGIKVQSGTSQVAWLFAPSTSSGKIEVGTSKPVVLELNGNGANIKSEITGSQTITFDPEAMTITIGSTTPTKPTVETPTFTPSSATAIAGTIVKIGCTTAGAKIYFTTGSTSAATPTTSSTEYVEGETEIVLSSTVKVIKAIAVAEGYNNSALATKTYTVISKLGPESPVYIGGYYFKYIDENGTAAWNGQKTDWENNNPPQMIWDEENQWYYMVIQPDGFGSTFAGNIYYNFFTKNGSTITWYKPNQANGVQLDKLVPTTWSTDFSTGVTNRDGAEVSNGSLSDSRLYKVFVKQNPTTGAYQYAITRLPQEVKPYTVKLDISQMGARTWDSNEVKAIIDGNAYNATSVSEDVLTFTFNAGSRPSKIYFTCNPSSAVSTATATDRSNEENFVDGKTYTLAFISSYKKDKLTYAFKDVNIAQVVAEVNLPYGPNDFKEPKYFLVGTRMGNWHLQPEWELIKQDDGSYKVNGGRFVYRTNFGVAKVNSYYNYTKHLYQLVTRVSSTAGKVTPTQTTIANLALVDPDGTPQDETSFDTSSFEWNEGLDSLYADTNFAAVSGGLAMTFAYNGDWNNQNYEDATHPTTNRTLSTKDKGTWVEAITLSPKADGKFDLKFTIDPANTVNIDQRMFSLVGEEIRHKGYETQHNTIRNSTGWQESWIQYDEAGKPYYDGNGNFLYHTAFVPSIFDDTEVKFQLPDVNGKKFDYTSSSVTFVEASQLENLKTDPYRKLYEFFTGKKALTNGMEVKIEGTDFAFKLDNLAQEFPNAEWKVFVIRDAWVKNQFKIWNGWSGNTIKYEKFDGNNGNSYGAGGDGARWNYLNAGPNANAAVEVKITDVKAGTGDSDPAQAANKLAVKVSGTDVNFTTTGNGLEYYNRIILLYNVNEENALGNSYVLFIQDDCQPVIKAFANDDRTAHAEWNLVNVKEGSQATITAYTITRYTVTADGNVNPKVVASAKDLNWSVTDLQTVTANTTVNDTPALNPGNYFYNIKVTYKGSDDEIDIREANSNRITIYGDAIAPQLRVEQLITLTKAGYDAVMGSRYVDDNAPSEIRYPGLKTRFEQAFRRSSDNKVRDYASDRFYITYIEDEDQPGEYNRDADFYAIYAGSSDEYNNQDVNQMTEVPVQEVIDFMKEPTYYKWAARFYVRALDKTAFDREYSRQNIEVEDFDLLLTDNAAVALSQSLSGKWETNSQDMATYPYTVRKLNGSTNQYIGAIVDRNGFLGAGTMTANLTYKYGDKTANTSDEVEFTPIAPMPYDLTAKFVYREGEFGNPVEDQVTKLFGDNVSRGFKGHLKVQTHSTEHPRSEEHAPYTVTLPEAAVTAERHLDCQFEFTRPNVSEAIFEHYNIYYTISLTSQVDEEKATLADLQDYVELKDGDIHGTYYDDSEIEYELDAEGNPVLDKNGLPKRLRDANGDPVRNPYIITVPNTHPSGNIYPRLTIISVVYERAEDFGGDNYIIEPTFKYENEPYDEYGNLAIERRNTRSASITPGKFGLGWNPGYAPEDAEQWFLYAHQDFQYGNATPSTDVKPSDFTDTQLFLLELFYQDPQSMNYVVTPGTSLWWHTHDNVTLKDGYYVENNPVYINSVNVPEGAKLNLSVTPVYLWIRDLTLDPAANGTTSNFRDLVEAGSRQSVPKHRGVRRRADAQPTITNTTGFAINPDNEILLQTENSKDLVKAAEYNKNTHGLITGATYDATVNHPELVVSPGAGATPEGEENLPPIMTGIEDVTTGAANSEAVYFNLQGIQVANPVKGQIYIRKAGNVTEKIVY